MPQLDPGVALSPDELNTIRTLVDLKKVDSCWAEMKKEIAGTRDAIELVIGARAATDNDPPRRVTAAELQAARTALAARLDFFQSLSGAAADKFAQDHEKVITLVDEALSMLGAITEPQG